MRLTGADIGTPVSSEQFYGQAAERFLQRTQTKAPESYERDPVKWVHDKLGYELKGIQVPVMRSIAAGQDTLVRSGHKCGKTFLSACAVLWWLDTREQSKVVTTAPGERQLKHILWSEIRHLFRRWPARRNWELTMGMHLYHRQFVGDWFGLGVYSNDPGNIEGFHTREAGKLLILVDEAKGVEKPFFDAVMSMQGQRFMTSVPPLDGVGYFADACRRRDEWKIFHATSLDSPFVTQEWIQKAELAWGRGSVLWRAKVEGQLPEQDISNLVIDPGEVERAVGRWSEEIVLDGYTPSIGCDVARFGDDKTVIIPMRGPLVADIREYNGKDTMWTVGVLEELAEQEADLCQRETGNEVDALTIPIVVDDTGLGAGVTDRLQEKGYNVVPVNFGQKAMDPAYKNARNELWFELANGMSEIILPPDTVGNGAGARLGADLCSPMFKYTSDGRRIEAKEELKKRLGRSPDYGDALALAWRGQQMGDSSSLVAVF